MIRWTKAISRKRKAAIRVAGIEAFEFDALGGEPAQLFGHHFAGAGFHHHAVAAPEIARGRNQDAIAVAIDRQHGIARDLQRIGMRVGDIGKSDFLPAAAGGKAGIVEIARLSRLRQADQGHGPDARRAAPAVRCQSDKILQAGARGGQHLGQAFGGGPAQLSVGGAPLALVEGGGVQPGKLGQTRWRKAVSGGQARPEPRQIWKCVSIATIRNHSGLR